MAATLLLLFQLGEGPNVGHEVASELPATKAGTACATVNGGSQRETFCAALLLLL